MNEETTNTTNAQSEKSGLDEKKKTALLRYLAIMFAVAFLLVLLSLLTQMRNSQSKISELNQSSTNALQNAELLQEENRQLEEEKEALQQQVDDLQAELDEKNKNNTELEEIQKDYEAQLEKAKGKQEQTTQAYEALLYVMEQSDSSAEGNVTLSKALDNLKELKSYLGQKGLEEYEKLIGEEQ